MTTLEVPLAEDLAESTHWSDEPPVQIDQQEFDLLAFELWHLGSYPETQIDEWEDEHVTVAEHASCL
jgi:hypothetical protein